MKLRELVYLVIFLTALCIAKTPETSAMSGHQHSQDMIEILLGDKSARAKDLRAMFREVSKTIDNFGVIKGLPVGKEGHRVYGHWGFADSIPFRKEPLKGVLDSVYQAEIDSGKTPKQAQSARKAAQKKIVSQWRKDQSRILKLVGEELGFTYDNGKFYNTKGVDITRQVKGLSGLLYDIHILGDYSGVKTGALQNVGDLGRDIKKNLYRLLGNNSHLAKKIADEIEKVTKLCQTSQCKSDAIMNVLKNSEELRRAIATKLAHKYPIVARLITSKPLWSAALPIAVVSARYNRLMNKLPQKLRAPVQAGIVAGAISSGIYGYKAIKGEMDPFEAATKVGENTGLAAGSIYISDAIITKLGDKYALQAIVNSKNGIMCKAFGTAANMGIATFIFDESQVIYNFCKGEISQKEFFKKTGEAVIRTSGSFAATYCAVALKFSPAGPVVMFISVGGYILADTGINKYKQLKARQYLTLDDILVKVPFEIRNKTTIFDLPHIDKVTLFDMENFEKSNLFEMEQINKKSLFEMENNSKETLLD